MVQTILQFILRYSHINWALTDQAMVSGVNFFTGILLARYLGLKEFGVFTLVWMAVLFVNSVQFAMISAPMMSIGPKQAEDEVPAYYGAVFFQQVTFAFLSFVILYAGVKASGIIFPEWQVAHLALPLASVAFAFQMQDFLRRYFFTHSRGKTAFFIDAISYLGQLGILVWLFFVTKLDSTLVLWVIAGTSALAAVTGIFSLKRISWKRGTLAVVINRHWHFSKWLTGSALMQWVGGNFFVIVAALYLSSTAAGAIAAARNVVGPTLVLFMALENIVPVRAGLAYHKGGWKPLKIYIERVCFLGAVATGLICVVASLFAEFWMGWLFGESYVQYSYLVYWFSITHFLVFFVRPLSALLKAVEQTRPLAVSSAIPMIFSLLTSVILVREFALVGAMLVMLGTVVLSLSYLLLYIYRSRKTYC